MRHYGLLNVGRDTNLAKSTRRIDRAALTKLRNALGDKNAVAFLCEINEGDDDDEMAIAASVFDGWRCFGPRTREPIFVSPDIATGATARVQWIANSAVKHWSPQRSVTHVLLADGEALVATHPPAGPYTPGSRPDWARDPLKKSWHATVDTYRTTKRLHRGAGRNVTSMCDLNRYDLQGQPGELEVVHEHTDYGFAWPAKGKRAEFRAGASIGVGIDSHRIQLMHGRYVEGVNS